jgi:putative transposase
VACRAWWASTGARTFCPARRWALGAFAVRVVPLPGYTPYPRGTVELINGAAEEMLSAARPDVSCLDRWMNRT